MSADSAFYFANQVLKDVDEAKRAAGFVRAGAGDEKLLISRLEELEYVLRGSPQNMQLVVEGMRQAIVDSLGPLLQQYLSRVKITTLSRSLPF